MKKTIIGALSLVTLSLSLGIGGCATDPMTAPASTETETVDTAEHALSVVPSSTHPAIADGRAVAEWHTSLTREGSFRVRGLTTEGETIAEFVFKPELGSDGSAEST